MASTQGEPNHRFRAARLGMRLTQQPQFLSTKIDVDEEGVRGMGTDSSADERWMRQAIELAHRCPVVEGAYSVGAVIVDDNNVEISHGYSRETDPKVHAEESALAKLPPADPRLKSATLYSTLEPCSQRASRPRPCTRLILDAGIPRVVIAWREPSLFVENCIGVELLAQKGVSVTELSLLADAAMEPNRHLNIQ